MIFVPAARWISLIAAFVIGAVAEYHLGIAVGLDTYTAALLPLTLDVWGFAAFATGRRWHVAGALAAMFLAQATSHLLELERGTPAHIVVLSVAVSAVAPGVSWACHRLGQEPQAEPVEEPTTREILADLTAEAVDAGTYGEPAPELCRDFPADPEVTPAALSPEPITETPAPEPAEDPEPLTVLTEIDPDESLSRAELAARANVLLARGVSKTETAKRLGTSRTTLYKALAEAS